MGGSGGSQRGDEASPRAETWRGPAGFPPNLVIPIRLVSKDRRAFSVAVFARHDGRVLLVKHKRLRTWLPVGGEIEQGESPLEAAQRELKEETGLEGKFTVELGVDGTPKGLIGSEEPPAGSTGTHFNF